MSEEGGREEQAYRAILALGVSTEALVDLLVAAVRDVVADQALHRQTRAVELGPAPSELVDREDCVLEHLGQLLCHASGISRLHSRPAQLCADGPGQ
jgi:hypothetical protein